MEKCKTKEFKHKHLDFLIHNTSGPPYTKCIQNLKTLTQIEAERSVTDIFVRQNKKLAASKAYSIPPAMCRSKPCKFVKNCIFSIKLLHAHLQYVCNIPTMH